VALRPSHKQRRLRELVLLWVREREIRHIVKRVSEDPDWYAENEMVDCWVWTLDKIRQEE
jgi:hypothetical protein